MRIDNNGNIISDDDYYCPYCDADLDSDSYEYCDRCGAYVGFVGTPTQTTITVDCIYCGAKNNITNEYCINCGKNPTNGRIRCKDIVNSLDDIEYKCDNCGRYNPVTNNYCTNCGDEL